MANVYGPLEAAQNLGELSGTASTALSNLGITVVANGTGAVALANVAPTGAGGTPNEWVQIAWGGVTYVTMAWIL